jgi:site-specific recombinase XerD
MKNAGKTPYFVDFHEESTEHAATKHNLLRFDSHEEKAKDSSRSGSQSHTVGHKDCPSCEATRRRVMRVPEYLNQSFASAALIWMDERRSELKPKTVEAYDSYTNQLMPWFGELLICDVDPGHIRGYQEMRAKAGKGASAINHELECILIPILKSCDRWKDMKQFYRRIPPPHWKPPKILTETQENIVFEIASKDPDLCVAYWVCSIMNNTTGTKQEIRNLRLCDVTVDGAEPYVHFRVETVKTNFRAPGSQQRARKVPLNSIALKQFKRAIARAKLLGAWHPEHYIFPFREKPNRYDFNKPGSPWFMRARFRTLKQDAYALTQDPVYLEMTPHWFRHQPITKMLENGTAEETVRATAGHVSQEMMRHYSHIRMQAKRVALDGIVPSFAQKKVANR